MNPWDMPNTNNNGGASSSLSPNPWFNDWSQYNQPDTSDYWSGTGGFDFDSMSDEELLAALGIDDNYLNSWDGTTIPWDDPGFTFPGETPDPNSGGVGSGTGAGGVSGGGSGGGGTGSRPPWTPATGGAYPGSGGDGAGGGGTTPPPATGSGDGGVPGGGYGGGGYNPRPGFDSSAYINPIGGGVYGPTSPFFDVSNEVPDTELGQNRLAAYGWLHGADQSLLDEINRDQTMQSYLLADMFNAPKGYGGILGGNTGYYDQSLLGGDRGEWQDILQQEMTDQALATPDELEQLKLKEHEATKIEGSPYAAFDMVRGEMAPLGENVDATTGQLRRVYGDLDTNLQGAINRNKLQLAPEFQNNQFDVIDSSVDPFLAINDPAYLGLSDEFNQNFRFDPYDKQAMMDQAARYVQFGNQATNDRLMREAAGRGNTSVLALNRARQENNLTGDISAADAMTDAAIKAKGLQLDVTQGKEGMRLGAEQDMANRSYDFLNNTTGNYLDTIRGAESMRLGSEQDISNRLTDAAKTNAGMQYQAEADIGDRGQDFGRYKINTLGSLMTDAEQKASDRALTNYQARTSGDQAALNTRYGQYMPASEALSSRFSNLYGQKKAEEKEGRDFLTNLYGTTLGNKRDTWTQRTNAAGGMIGLANNASGGRQDLSTWDKIMQGVNAGAGIAGTIAGARKP